MKKIGSTAWRFLGRSKSRPGVLMKMLRGKLAYLAILVLSIAWIESARILKEGKGSESRNSNQQLSLDHSHDAGYESQSPLSMGRGIVVADVNQSPFGYGEETTTDSRQEAANRIENELIVILPRGAKIEDLLGKIGGTAELISSMSRLNAHRLRFANTESAVLARRLLDRTPSLGVTDSNYQIEKPGVEEASAGTMGLKNSLSVHSNPTKGEIVIGLVDSSVQLQGTTVDGYLLPSISVAEGKASDDVLSHGTAMASSIVQGISLGIDGQKESSVKILPVDVFGGQESTTTYQVAEGVATAIEYGANIINLSLGSDASSDLLHQVIRDGHSQGVIFLGAAGNEPVTSETYPAAYSQVIAVTATDFEGNLASYANRGEFVDLALPGSVIVETGSSQFIVSGTSASTALASGIAAGYAERNAAEPLEAEAALRSGVALQSR